MWRNTQAERSAHFYPYNFSKHLQLLFWRNHLEWVSLQLDVIWLFNLKLLSMEISEGSYRIASPPDSIFTLSTFVQKRFFTLSKRLMLNLFFGVQSLPSPFLWKNINFFSFLGSLTPYNSKTLNLWFGALLLLLDSKA